MSKSFRAVILALVLWAGAARAQDVIVISPEELGRAPSTARITLLVDQADAAAEATRLLGLYSARRDTLRVTVPMSAAVAAPIDIVSTGAERDDTILVRHPFA